MAKFDLHALEHNKTALIAGGAGLVVILALRAKSKAAAANPGTTGASSGRPTSTPYALPTSDTVANDVYNSLYDNLISKLGQGGGVGGTGAPAPITAIAGSPGGGAGGGVATPPKSRPLGDTNSDMTNPAASGLQGAEAAVGYGGAPQKIVTAGPSAGPYGPGFGAIGQPLPGGGQWAFQIGGGVASPTGQWVKIG